MVLLVLLCSAIYKLTKFVMCAGPLHCWCLSCLKLSRSSSKTIFTFSRNSVTYCWLYAVWPVWAIYCTLGNFSTPVLTIILPDPSTILGNYLKGVKNLSFFYSNHFWATFYRHLATFYWSPWLYKASISGPRL